MAATRVDSKAWKRLMKKLPGEVVTLSEGVNQKTANDMANHIRRIAPRKSGTLVSTVEVTPEGKGAFMVSMGGTKTQRTIGSRTYTRDVHIGAGLKTTGVKSGGTGRIIWDYARLLEWGSKKVTKDPSFVPARRRASRLQRSRMNAALKKAAKASGGR